jgi:hypothetical protein
MFWGFAFPPICSAFRPKPNQFRREQCIAPSLSPVPSAVAQEPKRPNFLCHQKCEAVQVTCSPPSDIANPSPALFKKDTTQLHSCRQRPLLFSLVALLSLAKHSAYTTRRSRTDTYSLRKLLHNNKLVIALLAALAALSASMAVPVLLEALVAGLTAAILLIALKRLRRCERSGRRARWAQTVPPATQYNSQSTARLWAEACTRPMQGPITLSSTILTPLLHLCPCAGASCTIWTKSRAPGGSACPWWAMCWSACGQTFTT